MTSAAADRDYQEKNMATKRKEAAGESILSRYGEAIAALASGIFIAAAWAVGDSMHTLQVILYVIAFLVGGFAKAKEGLYTLVKERDLDVNLLMIIAAVGAASIGYWTEGAVLIFIFALSGALESYTMDRSSRDISALMDMKPEQAVLYKDGVETTVAIEELQIGDVIIVKPGERIAADGIVIEGASAVDQASITGESIPVDKETGAEVFAGTMNGQGALFIEVTRPGEGTLFAKILRLVQEAQSEKPVSQQFMERFERIYARAIIAISVLLVLFLPIVVGLSWEQAFYKTMVFLVVASPCALVASIMPAMLSAISSSARKGVLFKGGAHLENLGRTNVIAFDKTGTLTSGSPSVTDIEPMNGYSRQSVLQIAASIEGLSEHPLARAIVGQARNEGIRLMPVSDFMTSTGWGLQASCGGEVWRIGKPSYMDNSLATEELAASIARLEQEGKTVVVLHNAQGAAGVIAMRDNIREDAKQAISLLKKQGVAVAMLTGDQEMTARAIAKEAGIELVFAELLPEDKVNKVKELREKYGYVAMVGDGVNDAPALATATVGIAMGAGGSDAALETANVVLLKDDIGKIADSIILGRKTTAIVKQNIVFALSVILVLIAANFIEGIALPLGVVGHEGSTILVILNGLRLLRYKQYAVTQEQ